MPEPVKVHGIDIGDLLHDESLREWIQVQRWYASKSRSVAGIEIVENVVLREEPLLLLALVQTRFATGTHELYQLPLALLQADSRPPEAPELIARIGDWDVCDALADPVQTVELLRRMCASDEIDTAQGSCSFHCLDPAVAVGDDVRARLMGLEQSISSV